MASYNIKNDNYNIIYTTKMDVMGLIQPLINTGQIDALNNLVKINTDIEPLLSQKDNLLNLFNNLRYDQYYI